MYRIYWLVWLKTCNAWYLNKEYEYRGKKFSLSSSSEPISAPREKWSWLDPEIEDFVKSKDLYRDFVLNEFTLEEAERLKIGVQSRLRTQFKQSGVRLASRSVFNKNGQKIAIKMQLTKEKKHPCGYA